MINDRWIAIRRQAHELLERYDKVAQAHGLPAAFTPDGGSHRVLKEILQYGFDRPFALSLNCRTLQANVNGRLDPNGTVFINRAVAPIRKAFITAHETGHLKLKHPPRHLPSDAVGSFLSSQGDSQLPAFEDTDLTVNDQPYAADLSCRDGVAAAYRERDRFELEANIFAAELLAPLHIVRDYIENHPNWEVSKMAAHFGLSQGAMMNQLVAALIACPRPDCLEKNAKDQRAELRDRLKLNEGQKEAVNCPSPALVIAGPGAGKTGVLTARYVRLVIEENISPGRILAVTFSNKAAAEMKERISRDLPDHAHEIHIFTYHSFGRFLLQGYGSHIELTEDPSVLSEADSFVLARNHIHELAMGSFANLSDPTRHLDQLLTRVKSLKEEQISPDEFARRVAKWQNELDGLDTSGFDESAFEAHRKRHETAAKCLDLGMFYAAYETLRQQKKHVDYADLINLAITLFGIPEVATTISSLYDHILVDEFQDVNTSCGELIRKVDAGRGIIWAVADPRQSIYGFRGASVSHLARFEEDYPGAQVKNLDVNYRSYEEIVQAGEAIQFPAVADGKAFVPSKLSADKGNSPALPVVHVDICRTQNQEIAQLVKNVKRVAETVSPDKIAVLCRDKWFAQKVCLALEEAGINTNWSGQLEDQDAFKDMMAVLQLAVNQPQSLLRLARQEEHFLCESDLQIILRDAGRQGNKLHKALADAQSGTLAGITAEGRQMAKKLRELSYGLTKLYDDRPCSAWEVLANYLFDKSQWLREKLADLTPENRRYLATMCQVVDLAREFSGKGALSPKKDTRAFLDYVASARESSKLPCSDSTSVMTDAVNVLTMHKSKGLEWQCVFVPHWRQKKGSNSYNDSVPLPPHLVRLDISGKDADDAYNEACLYYVALTRAEEQLFLSTFIQDDGKTAPLPYLKQIIGALEPSGALEIRESKESEWKKKYPSSELTPFPDEVVPYAMIRQYEYCPRRAKYDYVYGLRTETSGFRFFKRQLREALLWIASLSERNVRPDEDQIEAKIAELWADNARSQQKMARVYQDQALKCARTFAARVPLGVEIQLDATWEWPVPGVQPPMRIAFKVGELEGGDIPVARLHRLDTEHPAHLTDPVWSLYAAIALAEGMEELEFELSYLANDEQHTPHQIRDEQWVKAQQSKLSETVRLIRYGQFRPKPGDFKMCHRCPYNLACPA
ncbi:MAG TPA: ATP-dependent helicase [Abditibacterium sp.]|jgi:DNA helicase-2/ATP-dependent DNA helicase PcrA